MIYSAIINSNTIIGDYSENSGDFNIILIKILKANKQPIKFYVVPYQNYDFYFLQEEPYVFSCIVNNNTDNEKVLLYLQSLKERFFTLCSDEKDNLTLKTTNLIRDLMVINKFFKLNKISLLIIV